MTAPSRPTLLQAAQLMLSQSPVGKPVSVRLSGADGHRHQVHDVRLRFDFPGELKCFCAVSGRLLFSASAAEIADVLKEG